MRLTVREVLGLPFYAAQILSKRKAFTGNPLIGSLALNRRGLHAWRVKTAAAVAGRRRARLARLVSPEDRAAFARDGFVEKRGLLDGATHRQLLAELRALQGPGREMVEGRAVTRRIAITPEMIARMPALAAFLNTPEWRGLTRYVGGFDVEPSICIETIFGTVDETGPGADPQTRLHMDTFHPTMKAWYFLEDVALEDGPFNYVPGSHRVDRRRLAWHKRASVLACQDPDDRHFRKGGSFRLSERDLKALRLGGPHAFAVPGNTLVVADTFGLHARGRSHRPSIRVEIHAAMRPNPFNPFVFLDSGRLPLVHGRKLQIGWWFDDMLVRFGLKKRAAMQPVGPVNPWEPPRTLRTTPAGNPVVGAPAAQRG